jgi:hypothetical protein
VFNFQNTCRSCGKLSGSYHKKSGKKALVLLFALVVDCLTNDEMNFGNVTKTQNHSKMYKKLKNKISETKLNSRLLRRGFHEKTPT